MSSVSVRLRPDPTYVCEAGAAYDTYVGSAFRRTFSAVVMLVVCALSAGAQTQAPVMERITFDEAIARALAKNPTIAQASTAILRAEGFLQQARAVTRPALNGSVATTVL